MIKKIDIEGMKCGHCSSAVKKALEALSGVVKADVSHETGKAVSIRRVQLREKDI